jgi:hypothetical protein
VRSKKAILEIARLAKERFEDFEETQHPQEHESSDKGKFNQILFRRLLKGVRSKFCNLDILDYSFTGIRK